MGSASEPEAGGLGRHATANLSVSRSSKSSKSSSLMNVSDVGETRSDTVRCLLLPKNWTLSVEGKFTRPLTNSSSESRSEIWSKVGRPWLDVVVAKSNVARVSILANASLPPNMYWCSSSSEHNVGKVDDENSRAELKIGFEVGGKIEELTVRFLGSQKSKSDCSDVTERE